MLRRYLALLAAFSLLLCAALTRAAGIASADGTPSPSVPVITFSNAFGHVIFVISTDGDVPTRNKVAASLIQQLQAYSIVDNATLVSEPSWTIADYVRQCDADPGHTDGAFLINVTASAVTGKDKFLYRRTKTEIAGSTLYAQCFAQPVVAVPQGHGANEPALNVATNTTYVWASGLKDGEYYQNTWTVLPALATVLTAGAAVMTFVPSKTAITATTQIYPTRTPVPPGGETSQAVSTAESQTNVSALGSIATAFLANSVNYTNQSTALPTADEQTWNAVEHLVAELVRSMHCPPFAPVGLASIPAPATSGATPAPFCGQGFH